MSRTDSVAYENYDSLLEKISSAYARDRRGAFQAVNQVLVETYWNVGREIVEYEQAGQNRAEYGKGLINKLAEDLSLRHGKGFSRSNLIYMRRFYLVFPKGETVSDFLSWSHWIELLKIDDSLERNFYLQQTIHEKWSVRELARQKSTALFLRLAAGKSGDAIAKLARGGKTVESPDDILREPYIFEFLKIPEPYRASEQQLETLLCDHLQQFLLELGKGFTFVGRQYRISLNNTHYRVDLVFYHRILRCFVLIDLKINEVQHYDISQMNMYLGYFNAEENGEGDNPPIGIILSRDKDELLVEYATYGLNSQLFVQKYQVYLPNREELRRELERSLEEARVLEAATKALE